MAIDVTGETEGVVLVDSEIRETRSPAARVGIRLGAETRDIRHSGNRIDSLATPIAGEHKK